MFKKLVLSVLIVAMFSGTSAFALGGGTSNADFLKIGVGARSTAMGEAFAAVGDDSSASFWNPAGIAAVDSWNFTLMHIMWYENTNYEYLSAAFAIDNSTTIGLSANYFWVPAFNSTKAASGFMNPFEETEAPASYDLAVTASVAKIFGNLYTNDFTIGNITIGANLSIIKRQIMDIQLDTIAMADVGLIANITDSLKIALVMQDVGTNLGEDQTPFNVRFGAAYDIIISKGSGVLISADVNKPIDVTNPEYIKWKFNFGLEGRIADVAFIRAGYKLGNEDETFTVGGGIGYPGIGSIDYAFVPHNELDATHRISMSVSFGDSIHRPIIGAPSPPAKLSAAAGDKVVSIGWDPNPEANIVGYNIYYRKTGSKIFGKLNKKPIMEEAKFRAVLKNNIKYEFAVTAINNRKLESVKSDVIYAMPKKYVPKKPDIVQDVYAQAKGSSIIVSWDEAKDEYVVGYNLYYKKQGDVKYKRLNKNLLKQAKATLAGLKSDIKYHFMVTAVSKDSLESDFSDIVSSTISKEENYY